ncbi:DUF817 family protein [Paracoccus sp. p3-h83]|uniref:DUF817 family protein n=1 Tax=Paracoccus sp. p3-h83 TaxID=3342805 RepID=UPI0035B935A8
MFVLKQAWACLFGALMLAAILISRAIWQPDLPVARYDALFAFALVVQAAFLALRLETWTEARVILPFHLTGTAMEWFKVGAGSGADQAALRHDPQHDPRQNYQPQHDGRRPASHGGQDAATPPQG